MSSNSQFLNAWLIINWMGWGCILWPVYTASDVFLHSQYVEFYVFKEQGISVYQ